MGFLDMFGEWYDSAKDFARDVVDTEQIGDGLSYAIGGINTDPLTDMLPDVSGLTDIVAAAMLQWGAVGDFVPNVHAHADVRYDGVAYDVIEVEFSGKKHLSIAPDMVRAMDRGDSPMVCVFNEYGEVTSTSAPMDATGRVLRETDSLKLWDDPWQACYDIEWDVEMGYYKLDTVSDLFKDS